MERIMKKYHELSANGKEFYILGRICVILGILSLIAFVILRPEIFAIMGPVIFFEFAWFCFAAQE